jgi:hypothetical protein
MGIDLMWFAHGSSYRAKDGSYKGWISHGEVKTGDKNRDCER